LAAVSYDLSIFKPPAPPPQAKNQEMFHVEHWFEEKEAKLVTEHTGNIESSGTRVHK
jgi:hypothetical protein